MTVIRVNAAGVARVMVPPPVKPVSLPKPMEVRQ